MKPDAFQPSIGKITQDKKSFAKEEGLEKHRDISVEAFLENAKVVGISTKETKQFDEWMRKIAKDLIPDKDFSDFVFLVQDTKGINAFITLIGEKNEVVFSKGIIDFVENKDQLAYILAHELTHKLLQDELGEGPNSRIEEGIADLKPIELLYNSGYDPRQAYELLKKLKNKEKIERDEDVLLEEDMLQIFDIHGPTKNRLLAVKDYLAGLDNKFGGLKQKPTALKIKSIIEKINFKSFLDAKAEEQDFLKMSNKEKIIFLNENVFTLGAGYDRRWADYEKFINSMPLLNEEELKEFSDFASNLISQYEKTHEDKKEILGKIFHIQTMTARKATILQYDRSLSENLKSKEVNVVELARLFVNTPEWYKKHGTFSPISEFIEKQDIENESDLEMFNSVIEKYGKGFQDRFYNSAIKKYGQFVEQEILSTKDINERYDIIKKYIQNPPAWLIDDKDAFYFSKVFKLLVGKSESEYIKYKDFVSTISNPSFRRESERALGELKKQFDIQEEKIEKGERKLKPLSEFEKEEQIEKLKTFLEGLIPKTKSTYISRLEDRSASITRAEKMIADLNRGIINFSRLAPKEASIYFPEYFERLGPYIDGDIKLDPGIASKYGLMIVSLPNEALSVSGKLSALFHGRISEQQIDADVSRIFTSFEDTPDNIKEIQTTGCNLEEIIRKVFPQKVKTVEDVINLHVEIAKENKEFADEFARIQLINVLEKFNPNINLLQLSLFLERNPTKLQAIMIDADEYVLKLLSYNINNASQWPKDITELATLYEVLNRNEYFPTGSDAREKMGEKVITYLESSTEDNDKKIKIAELLLSGPRMAEPILRTRLNSFFTSSIKEKYGVDDGSSNYKENIKTVSDFFEKINLIDRYTLGSMICDAIVSQQETSYMFRDAIIGEGMSRDTIVEKSLEVMQAEFHYQIIENYKDKEKLINFLLEPFSRDTAEDIARDIAREVKEDSSSKIEALFVGRYGEADEKFVMKKTVEFSELFHENFWSSSFLLRTAFIDKMLHEESKSWNEDMPPWDRGYYLITDKMIPAEHPYRNTMESFLKNYLDVLPEYQKSLFLSALMTAQQHAQETEKFEAGRILARILELLGPAEIKAGQVAHSYPGTPPDIADGLGRLKSKADVPTRWDIFEMSEQLVPKDIKDRIKRTEGINAASVNITNHVIEKDGSERILIFERENAKARIDEGFERLSKMADKIGGKTMKTIKDIIVEAKNLTEIEINEESNLEQSKIASENYNGIEISNGRNLYKVKTPKVFYYGDRYEYMEYMTGEHFNDLPEKTEAEKETKKDIAKIYLAMELAMTLSGKQTDRDRHGDNTRIDLKKGQIGLFDFGGLEIDPPIDQQKEILFDVFSSLFNGGGTSFSDNIRESIDKKIMEDPSQKSFLRKQEQRFLALGDYLKLLNSGDIQEVFLSAIKINNLDSVFAQKISELFGMSKEDLKSLPGNIKISNTQTNESWRKPIKIQVPPIEEKTRVIPEKLTKK